MLSRLRHKFAILFSFSPLAALLIISFQNATPTNAAAFEVNQIPPATFCFQNSPMGVSGLQRPAARLCR